MIVPASTPGQAFSTSPRCCPDARQLWHPGQINSAAIWASCLRRHLGFTTGLCAPGLCPRHQGHLMRRPPRWSGLRAPSRCLCFGSRPAPAYHRSRRPGRRAAGLPGAGPIQGRTGGWSPPSRPASWSGQRGLPYPWPSPRAVGRAQLPERGGDSPPGWS